jgi:hypothetical protein
MAYTPINPCLFTQRILATTSIRSKLASIALHFILFPYSFRKKNGSFSYSIQGVWLFPNVSIYVLWHCCWEARCLFTQGILASTSTGSKLASRAMHFMLSSYSICGVWLLPNVSISVLWHCYWVLLCVRCLITPWCFNIGFMALLLGSKQWYMADNIFWKSAKGKSPTHLAYSIPGEFQTSAWSSLACLLH